MLQILMMILLLGLSLRDFVKRFELGIDIDALIREVDEDRSG